MRVAIITDSTADIPSDLLEKYQIGVIPAVLIIDGKEYLDGINIEREEFYQLLPALDPPPTTAAPAPGDIHELYKSTFSKGFDHIISIHAAGKLSGIYNSARIAADNFRGKIEVIDSEMLSLGLGFQALEAAEAAIKGLSIENILDRITALQPRLKVIALLDTLTQLKRSGRVSWAKAGLGEMFKIKPFVELRQSQVIRMGDVRTRSKGIDLLIQHLRELGNLESLAILHSNSEDDANKILDTIKPELNNPAMVVNVTTVIGTHVGVNALGFAAVRRN